MSQRQEMPTGSRWRDIAGELWRDFGVRQPSTRSRLVIDLFVVIGLGYVVTRMVMGSSSRVDLLPAAFLVVFAVGMTCRDLLVLRSEGRAAAHPPGSEARASLDAATRVLTARVELGLSVLFTMILGCVATAALVEVRTPWRVGFAIVVAVAAVYVLRRDVRALRRAAGPDAHLSA